MLDISTAYNKYKFLGNEFLTWIWFLIENKKNINTIIKADEKISLDIGNSIVLENHIGNNSKEKITIKGDQAGLEEGTTALKKGAYVTQINLICTLNEDEYKFTLKGESLNITGLKTPPHSKSTAENELEGLILEKTYLCFKIFEILDHLFLTYVSLRTSDEWKNTQLPEIRKWIND